MRFLIVDDSSTLRKIVINVILQLGYSKNNIVEARNGKEAWDIIQEQDFDIVLTDLHMPIMSGLDLIQAIRGDDKWEDLPIVMITTEKDKETVVTGLKAGATNYIAKPFVAKVLKEKLQSIFEEQEF